MTILGFHDLHLNTLQRFLSTPALLSGVKYGCYRTGENI
jgi:hypothetical protein